MASPRQRRKVKRVMHEFKEGELKGGRGRRGAVKSRRQAIAIAMSESGQSRNGRRKKKGAAKTGRKSGAGRGKGARSGTASRRKAGAAKKRKTTGKGKRGRG
ncbi:MAG TPA: DUF6496 domain-containing protein [Stellaceae bacterium]|jgi:hypothetical protein|nr:DUF6496 domain-containing protein [Stellaceae bacterium]